MTEKILRLPKEPGAEADRRLCEALGFVPCPSWRLWGVGLIAPDFIKADECEHGDNGCYPENGCPYFSRSDAVAWRAVEAVEGHGGAQVGFDRKSGLWEIDLYIYDAAGDAWLDADREGGKHKSRPYAIAIACAKAAGFTVEFDDD